MSQQVRRSFRLVCRPREIQRVEALLSAQGYVFEPEPFSLWCRRLISEPKPIGSSLAAFFGYIYIQDRSSMLPPLALNPEPGSRVLDMCASPGGKTGFLAQLVGPTGLVLANESARTRLNTLRQNLNTMNLIQTVSTGLPAETLPLPDGCCSHILLDPPCSGWGTEDRNPNVRALWNGAKTKPLIGLQRLLLKRAAALLAPGGRLTYSTCTTNAEENEYQARYAVEELGLLLRPLEPFPGFSPETSALPETDGVLRIDQNTSDGQGFFIASFEKPGQCTPSAPLPPAERVLITPPPMDWGGSGTDAGGLPEGSLAKFGDSVYFVPRPALEHLPASLGWRAFFLGKAGSAAGASPRMRCLMPPVEAPPVEDNIITLNLEETSVLSALLGGRSLGVPPAVSTALLYWRGLPLGRLKARGGRALWAL